MKIDKITLIFFSPTGTTEKTSKSIISGLNCANIKTIALTYKNNCNYYIRDGIAVIAVPVYAGRVPGIVLKRLEKIKADGIPAVIAAVYGNRHYDDCLLELKNICNEKRF